MFKAAASLLARKLYDVKMNYQRKGSFVELINHRAGNIGLTITEAMQTLFSLFYKIHVKFTI